MGATTTEGTGIGSSVNEKPAIFNGVVKSENLAANIDINTTGDITANNVLVNSLNTNSLATGPIVSSDNITADGYIRGAAIGQLVNTYTGSGGTGDATGYGQLTLVTVTYTPVQPNVNLIIEYHADYSVAGAGAASGDSFQSTIVVGSSTVASRTQHWGAASGTGTRSGTVFPIVGLYKQTGITPVTINFYVQRTVGDDTITVHRDGSVLKISEYVGL